MLSVPPMHAQGGDEYISVLTKAVSGCKAFVLICSTTYGDTQFTKAEFNLANSEKKVCITQGLMREAFLWYAVSPAHSSPPSHCQVIIPVLHSGTYPPSELKVECMHMHGATRVLHMMRCMGLC